MTGKPLALGIDLGGTSVKYGIVSADGKLFEKGKRFIDKRSPDVVISLLRQIIEEAKSKWSNRLICIGVGAPGLLNRERTLIRTSPNFPQWHNVPLYEMLASPATPLPVFCENDANVLLFAETLWGAARGMADLIVLTLGTGVGGGILTGGELVVGADGSGGEVGHIAVDPAGPRCGCGSHGCLEVFCNITGVLRTAAEVYAPDLAPGSPEEITLAAENGDSKAIETFRRVGWALGVGLASLINLFNPRVILIGGGISGAGGFLLESTEQVAQERSYQENWRKLKILQPAFKAWSGVMGAAATAFLRDGLIQLKTEN